MLPTNTFTSVTLGQVSSPVNILKEVLASFNRRQKCKALILSWLDGKHFHGQEWVRVTFDYLASVLGYCRETISRHFSELTDMGLISYQPSHRFPKDTANEYKLERQNLVTALGLERCEKTDIDTRNNSPILANNVATYINQSKLFLNPYVAEEKELGTLEQKEVVLDTRYGGEEVVISDTQSNQGSKNTLVANPIPPADHSFAVPNQPTVEEVGEVRTELRTLRVNPDECMGAIYRNWGNVRGAIAYLKEAIENKRCNSPIAVFLDACKKGRSPLKIEQNIAAWYDWARRERIVLGGELSQGIVYSPDGEVLKLREMMQQYPRLLSVMPLKT